MTNHPDDISYPRCSHCHEDLVRCPACFHYEAGGCHHPREAARFTPDGEAAKDCPSFHSRNEVRDSHLHWNIPAPGWVSALMLLILLGLAIAGWFIDPSMRYFHGNPLRLETAVPFQASLGRPFNITMRITNKLGITSTRFYLEIGEQFMSDVLSGPPSPAPLSFARFTTGQYKNRLVLEYDSLPAHGSENVLLPFIPRKKGALVFVARIYAPRNQLVGEVRSIPIQVKATRFTLDRSNHPGFG